MSSKRFSIIVTYFSMRDAISLLTSSAYFPPSSLVNSIALRRSYRSRSLTSFKISKAFWSSSLSISNSSIRSLILLYAYLGSTIPLRFDEFSKVCSISSKIDLFTVGFNEFSSSIFFIWANSFLEFFTLYDDFSNWLLISSSISDINLINLL